MLLLIGLNASIFCNRDIVTKTTSSNNANGSSTNFVGISAVHTSASCYTGIPALLMSPKIGLITVFDAILTGRQTGLKYSK